MRLDALRTEFLKRGRPIRIVACKARRAGLSTGVEGFIYHDTTTTPGTNSLILGNQRGPSENVLKMCTQFHQSTPVDLAGIPLRPALPKSYEANRPRDRLEFPEINSQILIGSARSVDQYLSFDFQNVHATEVGAYKNGHELFVSVYPTLIDDPHSMLVMESTPRGKTGPGRFFFEQVKEAQENERMGNWEHGATRLLFMPWIAMTLSFSLPFSDESKRQAFARGLNAEELDILKAHPEVTLEQLLWRRAKMKGPPFNSDPELFDQEFPIDVATAFLSSGTLVFGRKNIKRLMSRVREPIWRGDVFWGDSDKANEREALRDALSRPRFLTPGESDAEGRRPHTNERTRNNLKVWDWPKRGDRLFIAGDVGHGNPDTKNGDFSVYAVARMNEWNEQDEIIMTWRGRLNPIAFAEVGCALAWACLRLVGNEVRAPELTIEWNNPGVPANTWIDNHNLYPHTYRYIDPAVHGQKRTKHIGWESNSKTKPQMVKYTQRTIEQDLIDIPDVVFVEELESYVEMDDMGDASSYGGDAGTHDDCVTALEIAIVRMRQEAASGVEEPAREIPTHLSFEDGDIPWDPFDRSASFDADDDDDEEDTEETLFYSGRSIRSAAIPG